MIGIIGAMDVEIEALEKNIVDKKEKKILKRIFYTGKIDNQDVVLVAAGIGKVNAAITTSLLLENFDVDYVINIGVAGGLSPANTFDLIIGEKLCYHDVDVTALGYPKGLVPKETMFFESNVNLINKAKEVAKNSNINYQVGLIASGDQFMTNPHSIIELNKDILAVEMEGAAIANVCQMYAKPFIVLRVVSDVLGVEGQSVAFQQVEKKAAFYAGVFVKGFIN